MKQKLLFVITQFYKGGAEVALLNLFHALDNRVYEVDFLVFDQIPLPNATSLLSQIPSWINVCNASEREGKFALSVKIWLKLWKKLTKHQLSRTTAKNFVKGKHYDAAFSYGEWMSPEFIARRVEADKKIVWIHTDIDKAGYVNESILLGYDAHISNYVFVSVRSMEAAVKKYPQIKNKAFIVHNLCNEKKIKNCSMQEATEMKNCDGLKFVSVGNLREEKNYARHLEVMKELKNMGIAFTWFIIGSTANQLLYNRLRRLTIQYQLNECIFLGVKENPYCYMANADALILLSDYESWSMVITEAKILEVPVIATSTSGAKEQLENGITGVLVPFQVQEIADRIEQFIEHSEGIQIRRALNGYSVNNSVLQEFENLIEG